MVLGMVILGEWFVDGNMELGLFVLVYSEDGDEWDVMHDIGYGCLLGAVSVHVPCIVHHLIER